MKKCFGDYMGETCEGHSTCKERGCFGETSTIKGACNCPYKKSCHLPRQWLQALLLEEDAEHICSFIKYFEGVF